MWLDGDGPDNGAYECSGSHNFAKLIPPYPALKTPTEIASFCAGEALVAAAADEWLIANKGYNCTRPTAVLGSCPTASTFACRWAAHKSVVLLPLHPTYVLISQLHFLHGRRARQLRPKCQRH